MKSQRSKLANMMLLMSLIATSLIAPLAGTCQVIDTMPKTYRPDSSGLHKDRPVEDSKKMPGTAIFAEISLGYSNYGMDGEAAVNYRSGNTFASFGYYKSHLCYKGDYNGIPFPEAGGCVNHITTTSFSLNGGIILPGKHYQSISCGISVTQFITQTTNPVRNDFSIGSFWEMASGDDYDKDVLTTHTKVVIGVPVAYKIYLLQGHTIGIDAGMKVDINTTRVVAAAMLGIRFGKIVNSKPSMNRN